MVYNPFTKKLQVPQKIGGRYGLHYDYPNFVLEDITLSSNKNYIYQYINPGPDNDRVITLDTKNAKVGDRFVIMNIGHGTYSTCFEIKQGETTLDKIYATVLKEFIFDGAEWRGVTQGTTPRDNYVGIGFGENANPSECGVAIGRLTDGNQDGVAVGQNADGHQFGTAVGYSADGNTNGVAVGHTAQAIDRGTALGYGANTNDHTRAIALGYFARNQRRCEIAMNIGDVSGESKAKAYNEIIIGSWVQKTANATPTLMYVDGDATQRFTIRAQSSLTFKIMVTARDNTTGDCAAYLFDGLIKRDNANNTALVACNKTVLHEDDDTWDCDVGCDTANEALKITVTGDAGNAVKWAARLDGVETSWTALN